MARPYRRMCEPAPRKAREGPRRLPNLKLGHERGQVERRVLRLERLVRCLKVPDQLLRLRLVPVYPAPPTLQAVRFRATTGKRACNGCARKPRRAKGGRLRCEVVVASPPNPPCSAPVLPRPSPLRSLVPPFPRPSPLSPPSFSLVPPFSLAARRAYVRRVWDGVCCECVLERVRRDDDGEEVCESVVLLLLLHRLRQRHLHVPIPARRRLSKPRRRRPSLRESPSPPPPQPPQSPSAPPPPPPPPSLSALEDRTGAAGLLIGRAIAACVTLLLLLLLLVVLGRCGAARWSPRPPATAQSPWRSSHGASR